MKPSLAEKLLGGHAAGILTQAEKRILFEAALDHQELFDALADEEALRELLADPAVRQHLLACLARPESRKGIALWRRPAFIGLAASLFALVTTSLIIVRRPGPVAGQTPVVLEATPATAATPAPQNMEESAPATPGPSRTKSAPDPKAEPASQDRRAMTAPPPARTEPSALGGPASEGEQGKAEARAVAMAAGMADSSGGHAKQARKAAQPVDVSRATTGVALQRERQAASPPLTCALEQLGAGRMRLKVIWGPAGHLYVLQRAPSGTTVLQPAKSYSDPNGLHTTLFEDGISGQDLLDVYVLDSPASDPSALPASGPVRGHRQQVRPE